MAAIVHARSKDGLLSLTLMVTEGNTPAINLYRSIGFQEYGVEPKAIFKPRGFKSKVLMWLQLPNCPAAA